MKNIARVYKVINNSVFTINGKLGYKRVTDAVILLSNLIHIHDGDTEHLWSIGEGGECTLDDFIVGAYWHYTEYHGGQWSDGYAALCALGQVFKPNMSSVEEDNVAYQMLEQLHNSECDLTDADLLFDGSSGVYIPQRFAREMIRTCISGVTNDDYDILEAGPTQDNEWYWETWQSVLDCAVITNPDTGTVYSLHQDDDVWLTPV